MTTDTERAVENLIIELKVIARALAALVDAQDRWGEANRDELRSIHAATSFGFGQGAGRWLTQSDTSVRLRYAELTGRLAGLEHEIDISSSYPPGYEQMVREHRMTEHEMRALERAFPWLTGKTGAD